MLNEDVAELDLAEQPPRANEEEAPWAQGSVCSPCARRVRELCDPVEREGGRLACRSNPPEGCPERVACGKVELMGPRVASADVLPAGC